MNNPNNPNTNVLRLYCDYKGWQGGTIHQAKEDFINIDMPEKDKFCGILISHMMLITDLEHVNEFMELRNNHLQIIEPSHE